MPTVIVLRRLNCWRTLTGACGVKLVNTMNRSQLVIFSYFFVIKKAKVATVCVCVLSSPESLFYNLVPPPFETGTHTLYSGGGVANGGEAVVPRLALGQTCAHTHHHQHHLHPNIRMATFGEITMPVGGVQLFLSGRLIPRNWTHFEVQHRN